MSGIDIQIHFSHQFQMNNYLFLGEFDHVPEVAFYMVGPIEEVTAKAARLAEEQS